MAQNNPRHHQPSFMPMAKPYGLRRRLGSHGLSCQSLTDTTHDADTVSIQNNNGNTETMEGVSVIRSRGEDNTAAAGTTPVGCKRSEPACAMCGCAAAHLCDIL